MKDPLASTVSEIGLCKELHTATLCTSDLEWIKKFFVQGMKMTLEGPFSQSPEEIAQQNKRWDITPDITYDYYHLHRPAVPSLIQVRLLHLHQPLPHIHNSYSSREIGPFSLGFPNENQQNLDKTLLALGIEAMAPMQEGEIDRGDGTSYRYWETIYKGPDFLHCVGIERGDGMPQLAPTDPTNKMGGPGYSAFVTDQSDAELAFYTEVLGMELRADRVWESSEGSALGIDAGVPFRFALVYAKGTSQNHLLFLDYKDKIFDKSGPLLRVPHQGLGMWSFESTDIHKCIENAQKMDIRILNDLSLHNDPIIGQKQFVTFITPTGFLVEVFQ